MRSAYHASQSGSPGYVSLSIFENEIALHARQEAIAQARLALGKEVRGPDEVEVYEIDHYIENR